MRKLTRQEVVFEVECQEEYADLNRDLAAMAEALRELE